MIKTTNIQLFKLSLKTKKEEQLLFLTDLETLEIKLSLLQHHFMNVKIKVKMVQ